MTSTFRLSSLIWTFSYFGNNLTRDSTYISGKLLIYWLVSCQWMWSTGYLPIDIHYPSPFFLLQTYWIPEHPSMARLVHLDRPQCIYLFLFFKLFFWDPLIWRGWASSMFASKHPFFRCLVYNNSETNIKLLSTSKLSVCFIAVLSFVRHFRLAWRW